MPKANDMSQPNQPTDCQKQIEPTVAKLREALARAAQLPDGAPDEKRKTVEADICLTSRSAYFDFYTWVVLKGTIDEPAERELNDLFLRSLKAMREGSFKQSVSDRYGEFKDKCHRVRNGASSSHQLASSLDD